MEYIWRFIAYTTIQFGLLIVNFLAGSMIFASAEEHLIIANVVFLVFAVGLMSLKPFWTFIRVRVELFMRYIVPVYALLTLALLTALNKAWSNIDDLSGILMR